MIKILVILIILLTPVSARAAPFLVCDPAVGGVDHYVITGLPAGMDGSSVAPIMAGAYGFKFDLAATPKNSASDLLISACSSWGDCSTAVPFVLDRPTPGTPANVRVVK